MGPGAPRPVRDVLDRQRLGITLWARVNLTWPSGVLFTYQVGLGLGNTVRVGVRKDQETREVIRDVP